ncbi:hypothetical protein [Rothia sp. 11254D007CT]
MKSNEKKWKTELLVQQPLNFGAFSVYKLLHLEKTSFTWGEETITDILKSQIAGGHYTIEAACPDHGDEPGCEWHDSDKGTLNPYGNVFTFTKHVESQKTGSDLGFWVYKHPDHFRRIEILFQAKKIEDLNNLKKSFLKSVKYKDEKQFNTIKKACADNERTGFYLFYIKSQGPHDNKFNASCADHAKNFNSTLRIINLSSIEVLMNESDKYDESNFFKKFNEYSTPLICLLAGCFNEKNQDRHDPYENLIRYLKKIQIHFTEKEDEPSGPDYCIHISRPHIIKNDFTSSSNIELIINLLNPLEFITFSTLAGLISDNKDETEQRYLARPTSNQVLKPTISAEVAAKVVKKNHAESLEKYIKNKDSDNIIKTINAMDSYFETKKTSQKRSDIVFKDLKVDGTERSNFKIDDIRIVTFREMKNRIKYAGIIYAKKQRSA